MISVNYIPQRQAILQCRGRSADFEDQLAEQIHSKISPPHIQNTNAPKNPTKTPPRRITASRASCASLRTRAVSTPTRLPRHFLTFPAMKTESTCPGLIRLTTAPAALL